MFIYIALYFSLNTRYNNFQYNFYSIYFFNTYQIAPLIINSEINMTYFTIYNGLTIALISTK